MRVPSSSRLLVISLAAAIVVLAPPVVAGDKADKSEEEAIKVVELVISGSAAEDPTVDNPLAPTRRNFRAKLERIRDIAADDEIAGVRLELRGAPSYAHSMDLLSALYEIKDAGKPIVCYTEMLTQKQACFATLADYLVVPPTGMIALEGLLAEAMYMKDLLAKVDVRFEVLHVGDYKTAYEDLAKDAMSDAQRESIGDLLDEFYGQLVQTMAENRGISEAAVEELFGSFFVDPNEAVRMGLVDAAVYADEFDRQLERIFGGEIELIENYKDRTKDDIEKMLESPLALFAILPAILSPPKPKAPTDPYVAIVYATGAIKSGKSEADWQGNVTSMGSDTIVEALEEAGEDENCKAIVLRVNSPGGSALASDMIWRAIKEVQAKGKPVVSSMGSVAASGGYWISMGCDAIVAQPSTITGSIGVVSMVPDVSQALRTAGVNVEVVARGPNADAFSLLKNGPTDVVRETLTRWMTSVYDMFIDKVSSGRRMDPARVRELAQGRVWTGRQALANGLVDELGGLEDAIALAAVMGGLSPSAPLVEHPHAPDFFEQVEEAMEGAARIESPLHSLVRGLGYGHLVETVERALSNPRAIHAESVQAVLPFQILIR